jgi:polysaccharide export outer membrane protein
MKAKFAAALGNHIVTVSGLALAAMLALSGCATKPSNEWSSQATTNSAMAMAAEQMQTDTLVLREGDVVKVAVPGSPNLDTTQMIRRDGKIVLPLIGEISAAGLTPEKLRTKLTEQYAPQISSKEVVVTVESSSFPVFVTGAVIHPGKVLSDRPLTALDAVMEAGGFDYTKANLKDVRVIRKEDGVMRTYHVNLKRIMDGKISQPFSLKPLDIIYIPERLVLF